MDGSGGGDGGAGGNNNGMSGVVGLVGGIGSLGDERGEYKMGEPGDGNLGILEGDDGRHITSEDGDSVRSADGLIGSSFLNSYGDRASIAAAAAAATAGGGGAGAPVAPGAAGDRRSGSGSGSVDGWTRVRGRGRSGRSHPRIRPTHERGASPASTPRDLTRMASSIDDSGLGGVEFASSPGGAGFLLDAFCSPLSENTVAGPEMTQAGERV